MKNLSLLSLAAVVLLASCGEGKFTEGKNGQKYKIIPGKSGDALKVGNIIQFAVVQKFADSIGFNSYENGNEFVLLDTSNNPFDIKPILRKMKVNDSAYIKINVDSVYDFQYKSAQAQNPSIDKKAFDAQVPNFFKKKGSFITLSLKAVKQYTQDTLDKNFKADSTALSNDQRVEDAKRQAYQKKMQEKAMKDQKDKDEVGNKASKVEFEKLVKEKGATWKKTPSGAYVEIITEGTGELCATGKMAELRYIGSLLKNGTVFDTNVKGAKKGDTLSKPTLPVQVGAGRMIKGFDEGVTMLRQGTHAKIYVPSELGYGGQNQGPDLPEYSNLIFDVTVEAVKNAPPAKPDMQQPQTGGGQQQQLTKEQIEALKAQMQQQQPQQQK